MAQPANTRTAVAHDLLWHTLKFQLRKLSSAAANRMLAAEGDTVDAFAKVALQAQGRWLAIRDVLGLISQLEDAERSGELSEEDADAVDG